MSELHFDNRFSTFNRTISRETLWTLAIIGIALILMACINFINLNTALAVNRAREVGIRKVLGSTRGRIIWQLICETAIMTLFSIAASLGIVEILISRLDVLLGYHLEFAATGNLAIFVCIFCLFILITLGAGFLPALYSSRFSPKNTLSKRGTTSEEGGLILRRGLVVLQFAISQALILSTVVISNQTSFLLNTDMGFDKDAVIEVRLPSHEETKTQRFKTSLLQHAGIQDVSFSNTGTASDDDWGGDYVLQDGEQLKKGHSQIKFVDSDFLATYRVLLLTGSTFKESDQPNQFLVNEAFAREAGYERNYEKLLGKHAKIWSREAPIIGVVKDFHTQSLREKIEPVIMLAENIYRQAGIKVTSRNLDREITAIQRSWLDSYPDQIFEYSFLDETIAQFYREEQKSTNLIRLFTVVALFIGCMGLFGLISYMTVRRTKEIGIRKVLGASVTGLVHLLSQQLLRLVLLANLVAWPIAWYAMNQWLQNFAYRTDIGWWVFVLAGGLALVIALLTVSAQAIRAALVNPVESLKYE